MKDKAFVTLMILLASVLLEGCEETDYSFIKEKEYFMKHFPLVGSTLAWEVRLIDSCTVVMIPESREEQPIVQKIR